MYGYVRPEKGELKIRDYETYRGVYCGLCHTLRKRFGPLYRFAVSYDSTFLAMLLAGPGPIEVCQRRCPYHPLRRTVCPAASGSLNAAADYTVILAWWKLRDSVEDDGFFRGLVSRFLSLMIHRGYRKASACQPAFARETEENLKELRKLEKERCGSLDAAADKFAVILRSLADGAGDETQVRALREFLYHLGRIVYVLDAVDDLQEDVRTDSYNPLRYRFAPVGGKLSPEEEGELRQSLQFSQNCMASAFALLETNPYSDILSNVLFFGLPAVTQSVFAGEWRAAKRERKKRSAQL